MPTSSHPSIAKLQAEIREMLPRLSVSQANVLGEMAYAMLMIDGCGLTRMCSYMAELLDQPENTLRQKYREVYYEKEAKAGVKKRQQKRREIVVDEHFADLLRAVITRWQGEKTLVLAMDASTLGDRLTILSISIQYRGCAMRVAWTILPGGQEGEWRPHWERMLRVLGVAVPADWMVYVMADRGLYAAWLYRAIQANGWHPFLRVKKGLTFRGPRETAFGKVGERVKRPDQEWKGKGEWSEQGERMEGTLVVGWEEGYEEPICVVTDLAPEKAKTAWYQLRFWIECDYKDGKRGWFHWEHTKMTKPQRASRLWLVLAIVMQKAILLGGELEAQEQEARAKNQRRCAGKKRRRGRPALPKIRPRGREQSVLLRGIMAMRAADTGGKKILPAGRVRTEPLPMRLYPVSRVPKSYQLKKQRREEKKRNRQRAQTKERRAQRAAERAAKQAEMQARQERRAAKEAQAQARRQARQASPQGKVSLHAPLRQERPEERLHSPEQSGHGRGSGKPELPTSERPAAPLSIPHHLETPQPPGPGPLLRLSRGRLQPPHRPMHKEIHHKRAHGPPQEAGP